MQPSEIRPVTTDDLGALDRLADVDCNDDTPLDPELKGYAAQAAIRYLHGNWADAVAGDPTFSTASVLTDIRDVLAQLDAYAKAATALLR